MAAVSDSVPVSRSARADQRRDEMRWGNAADGVVAGVRDEEVAESVEGQRCRMIEARGRAYSVDKSRRARRSGNGGDGAVSSDPAG